MAELFEEVVGVLESRSSTRSLAGQFRIDSHQAAGNGAVLGVPVFIAELSRWAADPAQSIGLLKTLRSIDTGKLQDPGHTIESRLYEPIGSELTELLLGGHRRHIASVISGEAGIGERSANALLPPTAWTLMASIADRYGSRIDRQSLLAILTREKQDLVDAGWGPWLEATVGEAASTAAPDTSPGPEPLEQAGPGTAGYPLPVARNARAVAERREPVRVGGERPSAGRGPSTAVLHGAATTGPIDRRDLDRGRSAFAEPRVAERRRSPIPGIIGMLLLFGLLAGALYWFFIREQPGELEAGDDTATVTDGADDGADPAAGDTTTSSVIEEVAEPLALELALADPQGRSTATGIVELQFDPANDEVCYDVSADGVGSPFDGFISVGPAGVKGGIVVDLGPLENDSIGCSAVGPIEMGAIMDDPAGHYVELLDPSGEFTIRAQLTDVIDPDATQPTDVLLFDPTGEGAGAVLEPGRLVLTGEVADQVTFDGLADDFVDLVPQGLEILNDLTIAEGAPLPSGRVTIEGAGTFTISSAVLSEEGLDAVDTMALILNARPDWRVTIVGHTDATGDEELNRQLSLERAEAVRDALLTAGVSETALQTSGAGSSVPIADNSTEEGRALNRRIEFSIAR